VPICPQCNTSYPAGPHACNAAGGGDAPGEAEPVVGELVEEPQPLAEEVTLPPAAEPPDPLIGATIGS
jgi:hypothetical protein